MFELVCKECGAVMAISPYGGFLAILSAMPLPPFCCEFADKKDKWAVEPRLVLTEREASHLVQKIRKALKN